MNKVIKAIVLSAAVAATTLTATVGVAEARDRHGWNDGGYREYRRHRDRDALVGGALGLATGMIIGGALANAFDRAYYGAVADFFHFYIGSFSWYVFNIADIGIVAGVVGLIYEAFWAPEDAEGKA